MLIGTESFGSVYKGILDQEELVAIKILNLQQKGAAKSFIVECNALTNIRHQNLVQILTCCSSIDYNGNEFKALVFEYVSNGSLENWLHLVTHAENWTTALNLIQRLNIAIDVASAICHLHEDCDPPIVHCNLKPSNVLLDNEMIAHVKDFRLASLLSNTTGVSDDQSSTIGIKGTIGYVAPEYAMSGEPSRHGDVYSYSILLLEMFTGRRPTNGQFKDNFNLHNFVKLALTAGNLLQIVDFALIRNRVEEETTSDRSRDQERKNNSNNNGGIEIEAEEGNNIIGFEISAHLQKNLAYVLEIGVACSEELPNERINMGDVIRELQHIKKKCLCESIGIQGQRQRTT